MEDIKEMTRRHQEEINNLQNNCSHEKVSQWMPFMWAPGHFGADVKCCEFCGKVIESQGG